MTSTMCVCRTCRTRCMLGTCPGSRSSPSTPSSSSPVTTQQISRHILFMAPTINIFSLFSPFAAVSLCGVAGLAETFPSFPVSGPFLPDVPGFQVLTVSFYLHFGLPLGRFPSIFISTTARMFSVSSLLLTCPNNSRLLLLKTIAIGFQESKLITSKFTYFEVNFVKHVRRFDRLLQVLIMDVSKKDMLQ